MDFNSAVTVHLEWKLKLRLYIKNREGNLNPDEVCKDNLCKLGKWLYSDGSAKYASLPEYQKIVEVHKEFHRVAGDIIRRANLGEDVEEEVVLGADSAYDKASVELSQLLLQLSKTVA